MGKANIGDFAVISSCGAYCSSMSAVNYNSYPRLPEILIEKDANIRIIRNIQSPEDVRSLEI
jgi:diaminopimelate decarboxylase